MFNELQTEVNNKRCRKRLYQTRHAILLLVHGVLTDAKC